MDLRWMAATSVCSISSTSYWVSHCTHDHDLKHNHASGTAKHQNSSSRTAQLPETSDVKPDQKSGAQGETVGISGSTEKDGRLHPLDCTDLRI